jgi:hypothetical protein
VPINADVTISNPSQADVNSIQHYVIKFASDLLQVGRNVAEKKRIKKRKNINKTINTNKHIQVMIRNGTRKLLLL